MGTTSRGSAGTHRHGVRAIGVITLISLAASLLPVSTAFAQPPAEPELPAPERLAQAITFTLPARGTIGDTVALEGSADSGLALDYRSDTPDRCAIDGTELRLVAEGTCTVSAAQPGDDRHAPAADASTSIEVVAPLPPELPDKAEPKAQPEEKAEPEAVEPEPEAVEPDPRAEPEEKTKPEPEGERVVNDEAEPQTDPEAKADPEQKAEAKPEPSPEEEAEPKPRAEIEPEPKSEAKAEPEAPEGNARLADAEPVPTPMPEAELLAQAITFTLPPSGTVGDTLALDSRASSGLPVDYRSQSTEVCSVDDALLQLAAEGTCTVIAAQPGDGVYGPAAEVSAFIEVLGQALPEPPDQTIGSTLPATGTSAEADNSLAPVATTLHVYGVSKDEGVYPVPQEFRLRAVLLAASAGDVTFDYATKDDSAIAYCGYGTTVGQCDYVAESGSIRIPAGTTEVEIPITVNGDSTFEPDERFEVVISKVVGATYDASTSDPFVWIVNDDEWPYLYFNGNRAIEQLETTDLPLFNVNLLEPSTMDVTFDYRTIDGTATSPSDYIAKAGTITIPAGSTMLPYIWITVIADDEVVEPDESLRLEISNVVGARLVPPAPGNDSAWITENPILTYSVRSDGVAEGDSGTRELVFDVDLSRPSFTDVSLDYGAGTSSTATAGVDFITRSGRVTIPAGQTHAEFSFIVYGDADAEPDEYVYATGTISGVTESGSDRQGWIWNDDGSRTLYVDSYELDEGDSGTRELIFEAWLSMPSAADVTFHYDTVDGDATAHSDYVAKSDSVTVPAGEWFTEFSVLVNGDTAPELDEWFELAISNVVGATYDEPGSYPYGDILNDDPAEISVSDVTVSEGTGSNPVAIFAVSMSGPLSETVSLSAYTVVGSAADPADYLGGHTGPGGVRFLPGATSFEVWVDVIGDSLDEPNETFSLVLVGPPMVVPQGQTVTIADGTGIATIIDDDAPAPVEPAPAPTTPPTDTTPPSVSAPTADFLMGTAIGRGATPLPLRVAFSASDPSGIASTALQHRTSARAYAGVALASGTATSATVPVGTSAKTTHQFQARATDGAGNSSPFAAGPAFRVKVVQDGMRAIKAKGTWAARNTKTAFGGSVRQASKSGASQAISVTASDLAIVSSKGPDRGKAKVVLDGKAVATLDLYNRTSKPKQVIYAVSFPSTRKHTLALVALGSKNAKAKGTLVDLDAFLALGP